MASGFNFILDEIDVTPAAGAYNDVDVTAHVPAGTVGVIIHLVNTSAGDLEGYCRENGSADDHYGTAHVETHGHNYQIVGVDGGLEFEAKIEHADLKVYLAGYLDNNVTIDTNLTDVTAQIAGANIWDDVDFTGIGGFAANSEMIILEFKNSVEGFRACIARENGSGNNPARKSINQDSMGLFVVGVDAGDIAELYFSDIANNDVLYRGCIAPACCASIINLDDWSDPDLLAWEETDVTGDTAADCDGVVGTITNTDAAIKYYLQLRKKGSATSFPTDCELNIACYICGPVGVDVAQVFEQYLENADTDYDSLGYFFDDGAGGGGAAPWPITKTVMAMGA